MLLEKKANGEIVKYDDENAVDISRANRIHLCWDCVNGYPSKCPKIADLEKARLDDDDFYDFIRECYQVFEDDDMIEFIVSDCLCFKKCVYKTSDEEREALKEMRDAIGSLLTYWYNTETPEEALETRAKRRANGEKMRLLKREKNNMIK